MIAAPRPATTVCVVRDHSSALEVLMARRTSTARFMGGAWVFPGGVVDASDGSDRAASLVRGVDSASLPWVAAGLRELVEEVGVWITDEPFTRRLGDETSSVYELAERLGVRFAGSTMTLFANWVTPTAAAVRFDTRFYAVEVPDGLDPQPDAAEVDAAGWFEPSTAHAAAVSGEMPVPFPTRRTLEYLSSFTSASELIAHAASLVDVPAFEPRVRVDEEGLFDIVLPGDDGYEELAGAGPDPDALRRAAARARAAGEPIPEVDG